MKQAAKDALENILHHHDTMKTIAKVYLIGMFCTESSVPDPAGIEAV